jgi:DNA-binding transcriptional ArsR family regulator
MTIHSGVPAAVGEWSSPRGAPEADAEGPPAAGDLAFLADVFGLLADPGRLRLLVAMFAGERRVSELAAAAGLSESAASHALRLLRAHGVVSVRRARRMAYYCLADTHVRSVLEVALAHVAHSRLRHPGARAGQHD